MKWLFWLFQIFCSYQLRRRQHSAQSSAFGVTLGAVGIRRDFRRSWRSSVINDNKRCSIHCRIITTVLNTLRQAWIKPLFYVKPLLQVKPKINSSSLYIKHRLSLCQSFTLCQAWVKPLFYVKPLLQVKPRINSSSLYITHRLSLSSLHLASCLGQAFVLC